MSDDFIPLNQSTPVNVRWQQQRNQQQRHPNQNNNRSWNGQKRGGHNNRWGNSPRSSFGSNSSNNSRLQDSRSNIDAYLHPSMLQDPWAGLRKKLEETNS